MQFDQSFLKLYEAQKSSLDEESPESPESESANATDDVLSLDDERRLRRSKDLSERLGDSVVYFGRWDSASMRNTEPPEQIDNAQRPEPSRRFRTLYEQKKKAYSENLFRFTSEEMERLNRNDSAFSIVSYSEQEDPLEPSTGPFTRPLKIFDEQSDLARPASDAAESKETIFDLEGEIKPPETTFGSLDEIARIEQISAWPRSVVRLWERGREAFSELACVVGSEIEQERQILGFGGTRHLVGTSTLLLGLTGELIRRHYSVLLIDADFCHPSLAEKLGLDCTDGWEQFLPKDSATRPGGLVKIQIDKTESKRKGQTVAVQTPERPRESFYLLPLAAQNIAEAVATSCRRAWLGRLLELAERFDAVLIDHGQLTAGDPQRKVGELLRFGEDGWFLIDDARNSSAGSANAFIDEAEERDLACLGKIDNFI